MPSAQIPDSGSGKYRSVFREAAVRFVSSFSDEPWELRGFENDAPGLLVDVKLKSNKGVLVVIGLVKSGPTMADVVLELMEQAHQSYVDSQCLIQRGIISKDDGWNGWLGRCQKALRQAAGTIERQHLRKQSERNKDRDRGR